MEIHGGQSDDKFPVPAFCSMQERVHSTPYQADHSNVANAPCTSLPRVTTLSRAVWTWSVLLVHEYGQSWWEFGSRRGDSSSPKWVLAILRPLNLPLSVWMAEEFHGCWGRRWLAVSQHCAHRSTIRCRAATRAVESPSVDCRLSTIDPVTTTCPLAAMYATHQVRSPNRGIHTRCAVGRIEMAGCLFMRHKRRGFHPRGRKGGAVGRKTGPGGPADVVSGSSLSCLNRRVSRVSDSFASGKEAAKQLGRPREIDETAESCSLFETRGRIGLERLRIGRLGVTWDSASDSAARRIDREVRHKVESGRGGGHDVERSNEQWLLEMVARDGQGCSPSSLGTTMMVAVVGETSFGERGM